MEQVQLILSGSSPVVLSGLRSFVEKHHRIRVIREVTPGLLEEALSENRESLAIVDWPSTSLETVARIAKNSKLIVYAMPESIEAWRNALQMGVRGFIGKDQSAADIRRAVLSVADGQIWIGKTSAETILGYELSSGRGQTALRIDGPGQLTNREKQVIEAACRGLKSRGIALALRISEPTVAHHLTSVYSKLGVTDRVGLIIYAYQHSLHLPEVKTPPGEQFNSLQISGAA
jgi:DNA-binding NarL/FixJ family response regulator